MATDDPFDAFGLVHLTAKYTAPDGRIYIQNEAHVKSLLRPEFRDYLLNSLKSKFIRSMIEDGVIPVELIWSDGYTREPSS